MRTVDDMAIVNFDAGLGPKSKAKVLENNVGLSGEGLADVFEVNHDGLDTVAFSFDFGLEGWHFVAVELVGIAGSNADHFRHDGQRITIEEVLDQTELLIRLTTNDTNCVGLDR